MTQMKNINRAFGILCIISATAFIAAAQRDGTRHLVKTRILVLTDISSLTQKEGEPDDGQSLIRFLLYTNEFDVEGLIASSNLGHGQTVRPDLIRQAVDAYSKVQPNLVLHDPSYPSAAYLLPLVFAGQPIADKKISWSESVGDGKDTDASEQIIKAVDKHDSRPLWIVIWGGSADLAQALWKVRQTRSKEELHRFISKIRVHAIGHQDSTGPWIEKEFPTLFYILRGLGMRGMYRGGDTTLTKSDWVHQNIWHHGALGDLYVDYDGGDIWSFKFGPVKGIKEGDSPSFLGFIRNGLNDITKPQWGGWGGRFVKKAGNNGQWTEGVDQTQQYLTDPDRHMASLYRWRQAWQADFASRLNWCISDYAHANHAPIVNSTPIIIRATGGKKIVLSLKDVQDPDHNKLKFTWFFYPEAGLWTGDAPLIDAQGSAAAFVLPQVTKKAELHLIAAISDDGEPSLTSYQRYIIRIDPVIASKH